MAAESKSTRRGEGRAVRLVVDGKDVRLNGFVSDVFRETVLGLVRALRSEDVDASIELSVAGEAD